MADVKIVPQKDWEIIQEYLESNRIVLIPECAIAQLPIEKFKQLDDALNNGAADDYDFGEETGVWVELVLSPDAYFIKEMLNDDILKEGKEE